MFSSCFSAGRSAFAKKALPLFFVCCLVMGALFSGCDLDGGGSNEGGFIPAGSWASSYGESYMITETTLKYTMVFEPYPATELEGTIVGAVNFSAVSGVLIIQVTGTPTTGNTVGKYTGVYYKDYTASHVFLANAVDPSYDPIETDTFLQAFNTFTAGNMDTHVTFWGTGYTK
jgi:hypothetical protein